MSKLIILRGISGSGKSTWAESQAGHPVIVSRDRIRMATFGTEDFIDENFITKVEHAAIAAGLASGRDVIVDNTNIQPKYIKAQAEIGFKAGAEVEVKMFDVSLPVALARNSSRAVRGGRNVPEDVIRKQHERLQGTKNFQLEVPKPPKPYHGTPGKQKAFLVDVDGTLAHMRDYRGPFDWAKVGLDDVDEVVSNIVWDIWAGSQERSTGNYEVIVMSGRDEVCRKETAEWLDLHAIPYTHLFMRPENDMRKDNIIKAELFDKYVRDNFDVQFVLDDRNQVVDMWREMGLTCLQVAPGDF